jgi:hypothetical protein
MRTVSKLLNLSAAELRFRVAERANLLKEASQLIAGQARWSPPAFTDAACVRFSHLSAASAALRQSDGRTAGNSLARHFAEREPRFALEPSDRGPVVSRIQRCFPSAAADARTRARAIISGRYDLLGYRGLTFNANGRLIDWHLDPVSGRKPPSRFWSRVPYLDPAIGDHKVIWELNRHQHWLALGRGAWLAPSPEYLQRFRSELQEWLDQNPPLRGVNWSSMLELALRSISWVWALSLFSDPEAEDSRWVVDLLGALQSQLQHISRHLSRYFSPNTHLLGEGLALYVAGRAVPELRHADKWERLGRDVLTREARAQVHPDGGHAEQSLHYHLYALDFYLLALVVARRTGDPSANLFAEVASRMARFCRAMTDQTGRLPTIGDDDGGALFPICGRAPYDAGPTLSLAANLLTDPSLAVGALREEVVWMMAGRDGGIAAPVPDSLEPGSLLFPDTGYIVIRSPHGHAIVDCGRHGFLNGGHAHADALSMTLSVNGRPLLIDPGTATYVMDASLRDQLRSTAMHNTLVVNGRSQSIPAGPFQWRTRTDARLVDRKSSASFDYVELEHLGYSPLVHRRMIVRIDEVWVVADLLSGDGYAAVEAHWHLDPAWALRPADTPSAYVAEAAADSVLIASTSAESAQFFGDAGGLGWSAPVYGNLAPSPTIRFARSGALPISLVTAIAPSSTDSAASFRSLAGDTSDCCTVRITYRHHSYLVALGFDRGDPRPAPRLGRKVVFDGNSLSTDARVAVLRLSDGGRPTALHLVDGSKFEWTGVESFHLRDVRDVAMELHLDDIALRQLQR